MDILLTGAAGFIGSHVAERLVRGSAAQTSPWPAACPAGSRKSTSSTAWVGRLPPSARGVLMGARRSA
jgi:hypothetical protein